MKISQLKWRAVLILGACVLALSAGFASAQEFAKPMLLVASPALQGPYSRTTLLAVPIGRGHFGFILNRPTGLKLAQFLSPASPAAKAVDPMSLGGPHMNDRVFVVVRGDPGMASLHLVGELFVMQGLEASERAIVQMPQAARYFVGLVAWEPGELADEFARGFWYAADADQELVFRKDTRGMWQELVQRFWSGDAPLRGVRFSAKPF